MQKFNYIDVVKEYTMLIVRGRLSTLILFLGLCTLPQLKVIAQDNFTDPNVGSSFSYDEIPVLVMLEGFKYFYADALYANNNLLYVNVAGLFQTLNIACIVGQKGDSVGGFIENESRTYLINFNQKQIKVGAKIINTGNGVIR